MNRNMNPRISSCVIFFIKKDLRCRSDFEDRNDDFIFCDTWVVDNSLIHRAEYRVAVVVYESSFDYHIIDRLYFVRDVPAFSARCSVLVWCHSKKIVDMQVFISLEVPEMPHLHRKLIRVTNFPEMVFIIGADV